MNPEAISSTTWPNPFDGVSIPFLPILEHMANGKNGFILILGVAVLFWVIYTAVVFYHWIRYGHRSTTGFSSFILHLLVSGMLLFMAAGSF